MLILSHRRLLLGWTMSLLLPFFLSNNNHNNNNNNMNMFCQALQVADRLPKPTPDSCFQYDTPPSCQYDQLDSLQEEASSNEFLIVLHGSKHQEEWINIQDECAILDNNYLYQHGVVWGTTIQHVEAFSKLLSSGPGVHEQEDDRTTACQRARLVYPYCYWCLPPSDPIYQQRREDFCLLDGPTVCQRSSSSEHDTNETTTTTMHRDYDHHAIAAPALSVQDRENTCAQLEYVLLGQESWPASLDLCRRAEKAVPYCDFYCTAETEQRNPTLYADPPHPDDSCWTLEDPPSCHVSNNTMNATMPAATTSTSLSFLTPDQLQHECQILYELMYDSWYNANLWTHAYAFSSIRRNTTACTRARQAYPHCQFCHPGQAGNPDFCELRQNDNSWCTADDGHRKPAVKDPAVDLRAACQRLEELIVHQHAAPYTADLCHEAEMSLHACEFWCVQPYLGADTRAKKWILVWTARVSALLSFGGAVYILSRVWRERQPVRSNQCNHNHQPLKVYHQLLVAMASFDIVTALAWGASTAPLPRDEAWKIVGVVGNRATCTAQAVLIQLGLTSVFYNTSLAVFYVLVIVRRWRERDLQRVRCYWHAGPLLVGVGLAGAVVPHADWTGYGCHILPPPDGDLWKAVVFVVAPVGFSLAVIVASMVYIYLVVRKNARASSKWSMGNRRQSLEVQVFWQSLLYTMAFCLSWPILLAVYLVSVDYRASNFALTLTVSFLAPLQGFTNYVVFIRPWLLKVLGVQVQELRRSLVRRFSTTTSNNPNSSSLRPSSSILFRGVSSSLRASDHNLDHKSNNNHYNNSHDITTDTIVTEQDEDDTVYDPTVLITSLPSVPTTATTRLDSLPCISDEKSCDEPSPSSSTVINHCASKQIRHSLPQRLPAVDEHNHALDDDDVDEVSVASMHGAVDIRMGSAGHPESRSYSLDEYENSTSDLDPDGRAPAGDDLLDGSASTSWSVFSGKEGPISI